MIFDRTLLFSDAQAITATAPSTNVLDTLATGTVYGAAAALVKDIGKGNELPIIVQVVEAFNNLTSLQIDLEIADDAAFSTNKKTVFSRVYLLAALTLGKNVNIEDVPPGVDQRFVRLNYTVVGTAPTLGKLTAGLVPGLQTSGVAF